MLRVDCEKCHRCKCGSPDCGYKCRCVVPDDERTKLAKELWNLTVPDKVVAKSDWEAIEQWAQESYLRYADHCILREKRAVLAQLHNSWHSPECYKLSTLPCSCGLNAHIKRIKSEIADLERAAKDAK